MTVLKLRQQIELLKNQLRSVGYVPDLLRQIVEDSEESTDLAELDEKQPILMEATLDFFGEQTGCGYTQTTFTIQKENLEKLKDYAFLLGKEPVDMVNYILRQFFSRGDSVSALEWLEQGKNETQQFVLVDAKSKRMIHKGVNVSGQSGLDVILDDNHIITISEAEIQALIGKN